MLEPRRYSGDEDQCDAREARHERLRLGPHHDEGAGPGEPSSRWQPWAMSSREQRDERFLEQEAALTRPNPWDDEDAW
jgi:hypothetical protein